LLSNFAEGGMTETVLAVLQAINAQAGVVVTSMVVIWCGPYPLAGGIFILSREL
jgi:hypothetical protein